MTQTNGRRHASEASRHTAISSFDADGGAILFDVFGNLKYEGEESFRLLSHTRLVDFQAWLNEMLEQVPDA